MAQEVLDVCLQVLKESNKSRFDSSVCQEQCIDQHPILPFRIVACTFFPTTILEIAVYLACESIRWLITFRGDRSCIEEKAY